MLGLLPPPGPDAPAPSAREAIFLPPPRFWGAKNVKEVRIIRESPVLRGDNLSAAQKAGLRYETRIKLHFQEVWPEAKFGVWFQFDDDSGAGRLCQTDVLVERGNVVIIFEIKHHHCLDSWWQLRKLYQPVVQAWSPDAHVRVVEICKTFDPCVPFPEPTFLVSGDGIPKEKDVFNVFRLDR